MTDNKKVKVVNENMEGNKETHNKDNEKVGTTTLFIGGAIGTITLKDTPKEEETPLFKNISEGDDEIPDLIVDDSEGSEGNIHALLQSQHGELDKEEVISQNKDDTGCFIISSVVDDLQLDKLEEVEDNEPWKL